MKFDESNNNRKVINIDLDGVLTLSGQFWNDNIEPNYENIAKVKQLYKGGNIIIIWTARQWGYAPLTVGWLTTHGIPFHGIQMGKGGSDYYIDDKMTTFDKLIKPNPFPSTMSADDIKKRESTLSAKPADIIDSDLWGRTSSSRPQPTFDTGDEYTTIFKEDLINPPWELLYKETYENKKDSTVWKIVQTLRNTGEIILLKIAKPPDDFQHLNHTGSAQPHPRLSQPPQPPQPKLETSAEARKRRKQEKKDARR